MKSLSRPKRLLASSPRDPKTLSPLTLATVTGGGANWETPPADLAPRDGSQWG
jgi:hypothetical protein